MCGARLGARLSRSLSDVMLPKVSRPGFLHKLHSTYHVFVRLQIRPRKSSLSDFVAGYGNRTDNMPLR